MEALNWSLFGLMAALMTAGFGLAIAGFQRLGDRIDGVELRLSQRIDGVKNSLTQRVDRLDQHLTRRIDRLDQHLSTRIDATNSRIDGLLARD